jgi:beta-phosphoglucomutase-like phosphatase (HAD superfamily)
LNAKVDLVIFDCDGVLVDSEVISCRAHSQMLTRHGYPITADQVLDRFLGVSDREARLIVEAELGRSLPGDFEAQVKTDAGAAGTMSGHRRQHPRRHRRRCRRDDCARLSRRQPLPARSRRHAARGGRGGDI